MHLSHFRQRGQFSLSALLLVSALLLFISGPFHAALAMLRADAAYAVNRSFTHYRTHATHVVRSQHSIGEGTVTLENHAFDYEWRASNIDFIEIHFVRVVPNGDLDWPAVTSFWFQSENLRFEIRDSKSSH